MVNDASRRSHDFKDELGETTRLRRIRIVETLSVKVLRESSIGHMFFE